jgi:hypothetical protein
MANEPEEYRQLEKDAQRMSAQIAADMIRWPRRRWVLRPLYRLFKWVERNIDAALKGEGWR